MAERRFTSAELDAMEQQAVSQGMSPAAAKDASGTMTEGVEGGENFTGGVGASLQRTVLGLKQAYQYLAGDDEGRTAINDAIKKLEDHPALQTPAGKLGDAAGTAMQFMGPQVAGSALARLAPKAIVKGIQAVTGAPGSTGRAALQGGAYEAAQPVSPSDAGTDEYLMGKAGQTAAGAAGGAVVGKIGKMLTSPGVPVSPERHMLAKQAERLHIDDLSPAQRTGDPTLAQLEEGYASLPGSSKVILGPRANQQKRFNKTSAEALGSKFDAPNEAALAEAHTRAAKGYEPLAQIPSMKGDSALMVDLDKFMTKQHSSVMGSSEAVEIAKKLKKTDKNTWTGDQFLEDLQGVRDLSHGARQKGDVATSKQLGGLATIMEDFAERRVENLAKQGQIAPNAMEAFRDSRILYAKIHAIEKATDPVTGNVSALKYLNQEFKRNPASRGPSQSPVSKGLEEVGATARVLKQIAPYIGSSGTAERQAGQALAEGMTGPFAAIRAAGPMIKNYMAAKMYMARGGMPGPLGSVLTPTQSMYVKRLLPDAAFAGKEGASD